MKKILTAALVAGCAMALSAPASAAITVNAPGTTVDYGTPTGDELDFTFGYNEGGLSNPFTAVLDFSNTLAGIYSFALDTSSRTVDILSATLTGTGIGTIDISKLLDDGTAEHWGLSNYGLGAGDYILTIQGTNSGVGSLAGTVSFAAVPEPATWALMILGFGLVGGALRRKERQTRVRYNFA